MVKTRYEIDPFNRLIITGADRKTGIPLYRRVVEGRFRIGTSGALVYEASSPVRAADTPHKIRLAGSWSLSSGHDLVLSIDRSARDRSSGELRLRGSIIDMSGNQVRFAMTTRSGSGATSTYTIALEGTWLTGRDNSISFGIRRAGGMRGELSFTGTWTVKDNLLTYTYEKREGARRTATLHTVSLRGRWAIASARSITYTLEAATNASLTFRTGIGSFKGNRIAYELGIGCANRLRPRIRTFIIYGTWQVNATAGLQFKVETAGDRIYTIDLAAEATVGHAGTVRLELMSRTGKGLGATLQLTRNFLAGDGEAFLRILGSQEERSIMAGAAIRW